MSSVENFRVWLAESMFSDYESPLLEFYGDENDHIDKAQESELAKKSSLRQMKIGSWNVKPTIHGAARAAARVPDYTAADWEKLNRLMVDQVESLRCNASHTGKAATECLNKKTEREIIFYSRSLKQGYVVAYDPAKGELRIITVFPAGKNFAKPKTMKVLMESSLEVMYVAFGESLDEAADPYGEAQYMLSGADNIYNIAYVEAASLGLIVDRDQVQKIVQGNSEESYDGQGYQTLTIPMFSKPSPDGLPEPAGHMNFTIVRPSEYSSY